MSDWYQQHLTPPDVVELRIRLGVVAATKHAQVLVELVDPITSIQIAQWSRPHLHSDNWQQALDEAHRKAEQYLGDSLDPF